MFIQSPKTEKPGYKSNACVGFLVISSNHCKKIFQIYLFNGDGEHVYTKSTSCSMEKEDTQP